ncbi:3'(2'),5'-bisphosphate nucleotidase [Parashewanella curva]|uniref:3'(2'),5'-bisphosphate nucleotidase CysQ n=1 Tax=Parashewanella curva TaxID=2338552 RepID=A0A3L8PR50_9GAMM|nr:3'(2'),5'-bisphosphate nucleotidase CysQ [Parashewanella curva]RLV57836.1 3'(2'),5'-bisphosphate nucleotidase [Parashewanella curva]
MATAVLTLPSDIIESVINIASEAGRTIKSIFEQGQFEQHTKLDDTPVTSADLAAHQLIYQSLTQLTPDIPILSEEDADIPFSQRAQWSQYWLVDPLDGTGEFIAGSNDFSVLIALVQNHKPVLGVVYAPMKEVCYFARSGHGAFKRQQGQDTQIHSQRQGEILKVAVSRRQDPQDVLKLFTKKQDVELIRLGGAALKSCIVAEGQADCYVRVGPTGEWDTGAPQVIIEEAGGKVLDIDLKPLTYNCRESLENPNFIVVGRNQWNWAKLLGI